MSGPGGFLMGLVFAAACLLLGWAVGDVRGGAVGAFCFVLAGLAALALTPAGGGR